MNSHKLVSKIKDISDYSSDEDKKMKRKKSGRKRSASPKRLSSPAKESGRDEFKRSQSPRLDGETMRRVVETPKGTSFRALSPSKSFRGGDISLVDLENQQSSFSQVVKLKRKNTGKLGSSGKKK